MLFCELIETGDDYSGVGAVINKDGRRAHPESKNFFLTLLYAAVSYIINKTGMSTYSDKLAHLQVVINCQYSIAQMFTREDTLAHILSAPY